MLHAEGFAGLLKSEENIKANTTLEAARDEFCFGLTPAKEVCFEITQKSEQVVA